MIRSSTEQRFRAYIGRWKLLPFLLKIFALGLLAAFILLPRWATLNRVVTIDETKWFERSGNFFLAVKHGDYADTYQKEHPGVTVMWIGAAAYQEALQEYRIKNPEYADRLSLSYFVSNVSKQNPLEILVESRKFLALVDTILLLLAYGYARRIVGLGPALIGFALIAFDPFHLALTRIMHLDGLLANFYLLSLLAYISYAQDRRFLDLIVSGVSAGLAWLTKSPGFLLIPTLGIVTLLQLLPKLRRENRSSPISVIWQEFWPLALWGLLGIIVFIAAWPVMWVAPLETLSKVFGMAGIYATGGHGSDVFFNGHVIAGSDFGLQYFYFYPLTVLWRATPLLIIGLFVFILGYIKKIEVLADLKIRRFAAILLLASLVFVLVMTFGQKKFDRYIIPVYPPMDILAGLGWFAGILWLKARIPLRFGTITVLLISGLVIVLQAGSSLSLFPNMLAYYNPMMGGGRKAPQVMQIGWGEGMDQAALYLNQKPGAENLVVSSWYGPGPFSFFFHGKVVDILAEGMTGLKLQAINASDYIVIYVHQRQRNLPEELLSDLANRKPEHTIWINCIEYVRIYKQ